jgi:CRP-like cAMP-binding protein
MRALTVVAVEPGAVVIRQGDPADRFYVISSGEVEVTQTATDGSRHVLRRMGPDQVFGEIGLLTGAPRSATVTVTVPTTLLALEAADFLALVSAGPGLTSRLLDLHRGASATAG